MWVQAVNWPGLGLQNVEHKIHFQTSFTVSRWATHARHWEIRKIWNRSTVIFRHHSRWWCDAQTDASSHFSKDRSLFFKNNSTEWDFIHGKHIVFQLVVIKCKDLGLVKFFGWLYVEIHVMDYCNKYALCKAKELKAMKYSILPTSESILADGRWDMFQRSRTWLLFSPHCYRRK